MLEKPWMWIVASIILVVFAVASLLVTSAIDVKQTFPSDDQKLEQVHGDQCERPNNNAFVAETQNTWSNLAYVLAGLLVVLRVRSWAGALFGVNLILIGITSALYHATLKEEPQILDVAWIYGVLFSAILYASYVLWRSDEDFPVPWWAWFAIGGLNAAALVAALLLSGNTAAVIVSFICIAVLLVPAIELGIYLVTRVNPKTPVPWWAWLVATIVLTLFGYLMRKVFTPEFHWSSDALFPILFGSLGSLVVLVVLDKLKSADTWFWIELGVIVLVFGVGIFCRLFDGYSSDAAHHVTRKLLCSPDGFLQAHAIWHVCSAAALLFTYDLLAQMDMIGRDPPADRPTVFPDVRTVYGQ